MKNIIKIIDGDALQNYDVSVFSGKRIESVEIFADRGDDHFFQFNFVDGDNSIWHENSSIVEQFVGGFEVVIEA